MSAHIPAATTEAEYAAIARDEAALSPLLHAVTSQLGVPARAASRFPDGSLPVYALDEQRVLKLYPPCYAYEEPIERECLEHLHGRMPIPTPHVDARGELEEWRYLVMSRLRGRILADVWPELGLDQRLRLARQLGEAMRAMHSLGAALERTAIPRLDWPAFVAAQRASASERQRARGLQEPWLHLIDPFLDATPLGPYRSALLHTEIMREHLLVEERGGDWSLSGLVDFEPSKIGDAEYELAAVGLFFSSGDAALFRATLLAYGYDPQELGPELSRRVLAYAVLHEYSNLAWYLRRVPPPSDVATFEALAEAWFGC